MAIIDYERYLDGDEWPSESGKAVHDDTGFHPDMKPVYDMPPQYAASAIHKLVRWARDGSLTAEQEDFEERRVRSSVLGRLLARKALGIEDFELYQEHGIDRDPLSTQQVARVLARALWETVDLDPEALGRLATETALALSNDGYTVFKESA